MMFFIRSGDFADALGEDYLGLRELGIAAEFGMSSLSIPKKLLRGKKAQSKLSSAAYIYFLLLPSHCHTDVDVVVIVPNHPSPHHHTRHPRHSSLLLPTKSTT